MGQVSDLPQYQASPTRAQLESALADVQKTQSGEHNCEVSKGDRRRLWVAVFLLFVATASMGGTLLKHCNSPATGSGHHNDPGHLPAHAAVTKSNMSLLQPASPSTVTAALWSATIDAPSGTSLPVYASMHQQVLMTLLSKQTMVTGTVTTAPSLTANGHSVPTLAANQVLVAAAAAKTTLMPVAKLLKYTPLPKDQYKLYGDCATTDHAVECVKRGFECIVERTGAGPICIEYNKKSNVGKQQKDGGAKVGGADHSKRNKLIGGIVGGVLGFLLLLGLLLCCLRRKRSKDQRRAANNGAMAQPVVPDSERAR